MKTLINITCHIYEGDRIAYPERVRSFIRPRSAGKPTFLGAARMVAKELNVKPSDVSVTRIEAMCYAAK
jgi:hypothetical protein